MNFTPNKAAMIVGRRKRLAYIRSKINHPSFSVRDQFTMIIEANDSQWIKDLSKIANDTML